MPHPTTPDDLQHMLRRMEWERAKGQLNAIMQTFVDERNKFERMQSVLDDFVATVEGEGLYE